MNNLSKIDKALDGAGFQTIFLVEDDEDDQELIKIAFGKLSLKHQLQIVNNGQEMLDALEGQTSLPCLIILDLNMPILNGIQTLKELKANPRFTKIPKVVFTTSDSEENKNKCYSYGAADYFIKPARMNEIVTTLEKIVSYCHS